LWAYGDSAGDEALLARADHPTWVGRRAGAPAAAGRIRRPDGARRARRPRDAC
jgi:phosphoserine phosphatase